MVLNLSGPASTSSGGGPVFGELVVIIVVGRLQPLHPSVPILISQMKARRRQDRRYGAFNPPEYVHLSTPVKEDNGCPRPSGRNGEMTDIPITDMNYT